MEQFNKIHFYTGDQELNSSQLAKMKKVDSLHVPAMKFI